MIIKLIFRLYQVPISDDSGLEGEDVSEGPSTWDGQAALLESGGERQKKFKQRKEMKREKEAAKVAEVNKLEDKEDIQHDK